MQKCFSVDCWSGIFIDTHPCIGCKQREEFQFMPTSSLSRAVNSFYFLVFEGWGGLALVSNRNKFVKRRSFKLDFLFPLCLKVVCTGTGEEFSKFCKRAINQDCQSNISTLEQDVKHDIHLPSLLLVLSSKKSAKIEKQVKCPPPIPLFREKKF